MVFRMEKSNVTLAVYPCPKMLDRLTSQSTHLVGGRWLFQALFLPIVIVSPHFAYYNRLALSIIVIKRRHSENEIIFNVCGLIGIYKSTL